MTVSQLKIETKSVPIQKAAPALVERIKQVDREGGHDELNHVFQLRKRHLFIFNEHLLHHVQLVGTVIWVKQVDGKSLFKLADGTDIIDCVYWHKLGNLDGKQQRSALDSIRVGRTLVVSGKPDMYREIVQIYVTRFNVLNDFQEEASFFSALLKSHCTLFERDFNISPPGLESRLSNEYLPAMRGFISYLKIRQALVNEFTRNPKLQIGDKIAYSALKQRLLSIAEKHGFIQKLKEKPNVLHQAIQDLQLVGMLRAVSERPQVVASLRVYEVLDLKSSLDSAIKSSLMTDNLTFREIHDQLTLAYSVCLSKETVFERVNLLFKLGEIVEMEGKGQGSLYSLL